MNNNIIPEVALEKIENKVEGSLKNCILENGWPEYLSYRDHVASLAKEVIQQKKEWLTNADVHFIFIDLIYTTISGKSELGQNAQGKLWDILGEDGGQELKKKIVDFFVSIPRDYDVHIPIPSISVDLESVDFSDKLSLVVYDDSKKIPGGYDGTGLLIFDTKLEPKKSYLRYSLSGYCDSRLETATLKKALSNFKIVFQQMLSKNLFKSTEGKGGGLGLLGGFMHHSVAKVQLSIVDKASDGKLVAQVVLPMDLSKFLNSIDLNKTEKQIQEALQVGNMAALFKNFLRLPSLLLENNESEALRVKAASEWCFDSYANENATISFLQTCIGLEALFGDDAEGESVTKTLADRCAYLVASDIKGRAKIRNNFKQLYKIRSKIVHGIVTSLSPDQDYYFEWGRTVLEYSINKEIKHLNLDRP